jgi:hypothetical protein
MQITSSRAAKLNKVTAPESLKALSGAMNMSFIKFIAR